MDKASYVERIIECLENTVHNAERANKLYTECDIDFLKVVIALLKAQEPTEPKLDVDEWRCGNCGHTLEHQQLLGDNVLFHEQYNYCPECGRTVKWE